MAELVHNPHPTNRRKKLFAGARVVKQKTGMTEEEMRVELSNLKSFLILARSRAHDRKDAAERKRFQRFLDLLRCME